MIVDVPAGLSVEQARLWNEFVIWCTASGHAPLPTADGAERATSAVALHGYLRANRRDRAGTRRARVTAVNAAYRAHGHPLPGLAEPVRRLLNPGRADRYADISVRVDALLPDIPTHGWPIGVHGRRDAALLVLAAAGLSFPVLAGLRQGDVTITDDAVTVGEQPLVVLPATGDLHRCPVRVLRRWAAVVRLVPHHLAAAALESGLTTRTPPLGEDEFMHGYGDAALFGGFDVRGRPTGHIGTVDHVDADHLTEVAAARLAGRTGTHLEPLPEPEAEVVPEPEIVLDPTAFDRGIVKRRAHNDLAALLDRLDQMIDDVAEKYGRAMD